MPKYELMYIVGSQVSDDEIPKLTDEVKQFIEGAGGKIEKHEDLGKRKLAYPIKKTRNGNYVLVTFDAPGDKVGEIEHKIRTTLTIIRHMIVNLDNALIRMEKDRMVQSRMKPRREPAAAKTEEGRPAHAAPAPARPIEGGRKITIDLDAEIEKAIGSEEIK